MISFVFNDGRLSEKKKEGEEERRTSKKDSKIPRVFFFSFDRNAISLAFFSRPPPFRASFPTSTISILHL